MSNYANRNVTAIMRTKATAELAEEIEAELAHETPETTVASLLGGEDATEQDETEELCNQSGESTGSEDPDSTDGDDE
jgi:hypothetical protein